MTAVRALLAAAGAGLAGYGGWLLWPQLPAAWAWLLGGPVLHDLFVAPAVLLVGLATRRLIRRSAVRTWVLRALAVSAVLVLIAVPLAWRPHPAPPNPGLQERDYATGLGVFLAILWTVALLAVLAHLRGAARRGRRSRPSRSAQDSGVVNVTGGESGLVV